jgi:5-methyltetrahydrofolate--homocysteine methyltransferase
MSHPFDLLAECRHRVVLADGAMGTELQRAGLAPGEPGERWNIERPDVVAAIQRAYIQAGSECLITNSFGANRWVLGRYGLADAVEPINTAAAAVARRAAGARAIVLGDIGPFGGLLAPLGEVAVADVREAFLAQARALLAAGVDGIIIETMSAIEEAEAAVHAAREAGARLVVASMAFDRTRKGGLRTMMGVSPGDAARALAAAGAHVVGANCGTSLGPPDFVDIVRAMKAAAEAPVIIQSNAGQPDLVDGHAVYRLSPADFAAGCREVVAAGATVIGGCCGTTPAHIAALREMIGHRN